MPGGIGYSKHFGLGIKRYALRYATRAASGNEVVTGVGFTPKIFVFLGSDSTAANINFSVGFDIVSTRRCLYIADNATYKTMGGTNSIMVRRDVLNNIYGYVSAVSNDGFTITWTLTGACSAQYTVLILG